MIPADIVLVVVSIVDRKKIKLPKKSKKPARKSRLTPERIEELLLRGAENAAELDKQLRQVFRMPNRNLYLD